MLSTKRTEIPASISAEYCSTATSNCARVWHCTELHHQRCWFFKCQLNCSSFSFSADCQVETSGLFYISSNGGQNHSKMKNGSNVQTCLFMLKPWWKPSTAVFMFNLLERLKIILRSESSWTTEKQYEMGYRMSRTCINGTSLICYMPFSNSHLLLHLFWCKYAYMYFGVLPIAAILQNSYCCLDWMLWES